MDKKGNDRQFVLQIKVNPGSNWMNYVFRDSREECEEVVGKLSNIFEEVEDWRIKTQKRCR